MRAFRDQQVAAIVLGVDGSQVDPAAAELSPGLVGSAGGRGAKCENVNTARGTPAGRGSCRAFPFPQGGRKLRPSGAVRCRWTSPAEGFVVKQ